MISSKQIDDFKNEMSKHRYDVGSAKLEKMEKEFIQMVKLYSKENPTDTKNLKRWRNWYAAVRDDLHSIIHPSVKKEGTPKNDNVANDETKQESNASNDNPKECACDAAAELKKMNKLQLLEGFKDRINKQMQLLNEMEYSKNWQKEYDSLIFLLNALRNIDKNVKDIDENGNDMYLSTVVRPYWAEHLQEKCQQYLKDAQTSFKR